MLSDWQGPVDLICIVFAGRSTWYSSSSLRNSQRLCWIGCWLQAHWESRSCFFNHHGVLHDGRVFDLKILKGCPLARCENLRVPTDISTFNGSTFRTLIYVSKNKKCKRISSYFKQCQDTVRISCVGGLPQKCHLGRVHCGEVCACLRPADKFTANHGGVHWDVNRSLHFACHITRLAQS